MAIYELVMQYTVYEQECQNRFYYKSGTPGDVANGAEDVCVGFELTCAAAIEDVWTGQVGGVDWHLLKARDLYNALDFYENTTVGRVGTNTDTTPAVPSFTSVSLRSPRYRVGRNRWYKRFAGIPEGTLDGNEWNDAVNQAALEAALVDTFVGVSSGATMTPLHLFLEKTVAEGTGKITYAPYEDEAIQRFWAHTVDQVDYHRMTTQRTRLVGVGI
jgi:hypothetical protein